jgi:hypothetical protein
MLMQLTAMNPPLAVANLDKYNSEELGPQIPTRSPRFSPSCVSPAARISAWNRIQN